MPKYRMLLTRTRTTKEHAVVVVASPGEAHARQDVENASRFDRSYTWTEDSLDTSAVTFNHIEEL
jgi:hypothetical protein